MNTASIQNTDGGYVSASGTNLTGAVNLHSTVSFSLPLQSVLVLEAKASPGYVFGLFNTSQSVVNTPQTTVDFSAGTNIIAEFFTVQQHANNLKAILGYAPEATADADKDLRVTLKDRLILTSNMQQAHQPA